MITINKKRWTLIEHLRGLGIEPEAPFHPAWEDLENNWGADFKREGTLTFTMLEKIPTLALPAAPVAVTFYKWAAQNNWDFTPFKGTVNADSRVRAAMCEYATARISANNGIYQGMDDLLKRLVEQAPLTPEFSRMLERTFNQEMDAQRSTSAWLAPLTGSLPAIGTWPEMAKNLNYQYGLKPEDVQMFVESPGNEEHHWSKNHRMELILAAWLEARDSAYLTMPLYNHLPNISMDHPDEVTAVFWMVASQYVDMHPDGKEAQMLAQWMAQYPDYQAFVQDKRSIIENLMGSDPVVCGKSLHHFWTERHTSSLATPSLDGLLQP